MNEAHSAFREFTGVVVGGAEETTMQCDERHRREMHKALKSRNPDEGHLTWFGAQEAPLQRTPKGQIGVILAKEGKVILGRGNGLYKGLERSKNKGHPSIASYQHG